MAAAFTSAIEAWDKRWASAEGRADWLDPEPEIMATLTGAEGARRPHRTRSRLRCRPARAPSRRARARRRGARRQCEGPPNCPRERTGPRPIAGRAPGDGRCAAVRRRHLRFRAVVECDPPRDIGRCRAAAGRDLARAEAQGTLPGHDAADAQHQLRTRPHRRPRHLCPRPGRGARAPAFLLRCGDPGCAIRRVRAAFSQAAAAAQARLLALANAGRNKSATLSYWKHNRGIGCEAS
jgi:hypothetical protein